MKLYAIREMDVLREPEYFAHVLAMTAEQLHSKSDIAAELAYRDLKIKEVVGAEHQARCDLIDALFYVDLICGRHGPGITDHERIRAEKFSSLMSERYPMQKGRRFQSDAETDRP